MTAEIHIVNRNRGRVDAELWKNIPADNEIPYLTQVLVNWVRCADSEESAIDILTDDARRLGLTVTDTRDYTD